MAISNSHFSDFTATSTKLMTAATLFVLKKVQWLL